MFRLLKKVAAFARDLYHGIVDKPRKLPLLTLICVAGTSFCYAGSKLFVVNTLLKFAGITGAGYIAFQAVTILSETHFIITTRGIEFWKQLKAGSSRPYLPKQINFLLKNLFDNANRDQIFEASKALRSFRVDIFLDEIAGKANKTFTETPQKNRCFFPLNHDSGKKWCLFVINRGAPFQIDYYDPLGSEMQNKLFSLPIKAEYVLMQKTTAVLIDDDNDSGPWIIEAANAIRENQQELPEIDPATSLIIRKHHAKIISRENFGIVTVLSYINGIIPNVLLTYLGTTTIFECFGVNSGWAIIPTSLVFIISNSFTYWAYTHQAAISENPFAKGKAPLTAAAITTCLPWGLALTGYRFFQFDQTMDITPYIENIPQIARRISGAAIAGNFVFIAMWTRLKAAYYIFKNKFYPTPNESYNPEDDPLPRLSTTSQVIFRTHQTLAIVHFPIFGSAFYIGCLKLLDELGLDSSAWEAQLVIIISSASACFAEYAFNYPKLIENVRGAVANYRPTMGEESDPLLEHQDQTEYSQTPQESP